MTTTFSRDDAGAIADEVIAAQAAGGQLAPISQRRPGFGLPDAYAVTAALRRLRQARGETPVGRKIGFTNRAMWVEYGVHAPIWGDMYASTVHDLPAGGSRFPLAGQAEPKIEPEIAFGIGAAPQPGMDDRQILGCVAWVAHAFEVVQSRFPGWQFSAADGVASGGLHGALLLGERVDVAVAQAPDWHDRLLNFEVDILRDGEVVDRGKGLNVLDGPLSALRHLVELLAADPHNPQLAPGEIVTTGTLTRAFSIAPGERWSTQVRGIALPGLDVTFV
jgi:2-oxo-3-hexenedioate decarboxylase